MGLHLLGDLGLALPIACVDSLGELAKLGEGWRLPNVGDLILHAIGEAVVEVVPKGTLSVSSHLQSKPIELNDILRNALTVLHGEVVELVLSISDGVVRPEVSLEL